MRIKKRRFGRNGESAYATGATHVIKIGFDARANGAAYPKPGKLPGFLICRDTLDGNNQLVVDYDCMHNIGEQYTPDSIAQAKQAQLKSPEGLLPTELFFVLAYNAKPAGDSWDYPGTFAEGYECWRKNGLFCQGDGERATRRQDDGTRAVIPCVPVGIDDAPAASFCQESVSKECKAHSRLLLCLYFLGQDGRPEPLSKSLGWQARFRFDTSSEYCAPRVLAELDQAAGRLDGHISGITGALSFLKQKKRHAAGVGITGQVLFAMSETDIAERERALFNRRIEEKRVSLLAAPAAVECVDARNPFENAETNALPAPVLPPDYEADFETQEPPFTDSSGDEPRVADASDEDLADSLVAFAGDRLGEFAYYTFKGAQHPINEINWFFEGETDSKDASRRRLLRDICQRLEEMPNTAFEIIPCKEVL